MLQNELHERDEHAQANWRSLYRLAGVGALLGLALMLTDIGLTFAGGDVQVGGLSALDWFALYQRNWFLGLRNLGFFNVLSTTLSIPLYLALYRLHKYAAPAYAALALALFLFGAAIYSGNNRAFAMMTLSSQVASAQTEAEQSLLAAAGTVILAQAEDFTPGAFMGFLLNSTGSILMMAVMLAGRVFGKRTAVAGLLGSAGLLVFTISVTFAPETMSLMMVLALVCGLLMMGWNAAVAVALFRLGRSPALQPAAVTTAS
jgi:hypothetical protein